MPTFRPTALRIQPDVTPLIDVMLVLMIIFATVAPVMIPHSQVRLPESRNFHARNDRTEDQTLGIDADGIYYFNRRPIPRDALARMLSAAFAGQPNDRVLYIKADPNLSYLVVVDALEIARQHGVLVAGLITENGSQSSAGRAP